MESTYGWSPGVERSYSVPGSGGFSESPSSYTRTDRTEAEGRSAAVAGWKTAHVSIVVAARSGAGVVVGVDSRLVIASPAGSWVFDSEHKLVALESVPLLVGATGVTRAGPWSLARTVEALGEELEPGAPFDSVATIVSRRVGETFAAATPPPGAVAEVLLAGYEDGSPRTCSVVVRAGGEASVQPHEAGLGIVWQGETAALDRLIKGIDRSLAAELGGAGRNGRLDHADAEVRFPLDAMPLADVVGLVASLVDLAKTYQRLLPGVPTIGGSTVVGVCDPDGRISVSELGRVDPSD